MITQLRDDWQAYQKFYEVPDSKRSFLKTLLTNDSFLLLTLVRIRSFAYEKRLQILSRMVRLLQLGLFGADIDACAKIGTGVIFMHTVGVVIGGKSDVGAGCLFMGSNTLGTHENNGYPVLESGVVLGAGSRIIGPVHIASRAKVGANAVVTKDVPAERTVVGANKLL